MAMPALRLNGQRYQANVQIFTFRQLRFVSCHVNVRKKTSRKRKAALGLLPSNKFNSAPSLQYEWHV